jgi:hypothetical protein
MIKSIDGVMSNLVANIETLDQAQRFSTSLARWGEINKAKNGVSCYTVFVRV